MIFNNLDQIDTSKIPVVIVGSGPAAITLAIELEKNNIDSLVIEAGEEKYNHESQQNYQGQIVGDSITGLTHNRLRQFGGSRMGGNPKTSVVDKNLKLHNNKNLYVAGSSNFVSGGYANPTYTIVQMSLRLANEISEKLI